MVGVDLAMTITVEFDNMAHTITYGFYWNWPERTIDNGIQHSDKVSQPIGPLYVIGAEIMATTWTSTLYYMADSSISKVYIHGLYVEFEGCILAIDKYTVYRRMGYDEY
jgi:hypothetical protein